MADEPQTTQDASFGFGVAGFILGATMLQASVRRGEITAEDARKIISDARKSLGEFFPGPSQAADFAEQALQSAEAMIAVVATEKPPAGSH
jgi:hypothetical protein